MINYNEKQRYIDVEKEVARKHANRERLRQMAEADEEREGRVQPVIGNYVTERVVTNQNTRKKVIQRMPTPHERANGVRASAVDGVHSGKADAIRKNMNETIKREVPTIKPFSKL